MMMMTMRLLVGIFQLQLTRALRERSMLSLSSSTVPPSRGWSPWVSLRGEGGGVVVLLGGGAHGQSERGGAVPPSRVCGDHGSV